MPTYSTIRYSELKITANMTLLRMRAFSCWCLDLVVPRGNVPTRREVFEMMSAALECEVDHYCSISSPPGISLRSGIPIFAKDCHYGS